MTLFQNDCLKVTFNKESQYVTATWFGFINTNQYRIATDMLIDLLAGNNAKGLSIDTCKQRGMNVDDMEYTAQKLNLYQKQHGSLKVALTVPLNIDKVVTEEFTDVIKGNKVEIKFCKKAEEAHSWLTADAVVKVA